MRLAEICRLMVKNVEKQKVTESCNATLHRCLEQQIFTIKRRRSELKGS